MLIHRLSTRASGLIAACMVLLTGCTSWRVQGVAPGQLVEQRHPQRLRVRHDGGTAVVLERPWIRHDSMLGITKRDTLGIPLPSIDDVATRRFDPLETAGVVLLTTGVVFAIGCAASCGSYGLGY